LIRSYRLETAEKLKQVEELTDTEHPKVFHVTRCAICKAQLDLPAVHFMCNHSYHQRYVSCPPPPRSASFADDDSLGMIGAYKNTIKNAPIAQENTVSFARSGGTTRDWRISMMFSSRTCRREGLKPSLRLTEEVL
jgi:hypothetical protein